jgi:hypothetical protein
MSGAISVPTAVLASVVDVGATVPTVANVETSAVEELFESSVPGRNGLAAQVAASLVNGVSAPFVELHAVLPAGVPIKTSEAAVFVPFSVICAVNAASVGEAIAARQSGTAKRTKRRSARADGRRRRVTDAPRPGA